MAFLRKGERSGYTLAELMVVLALGGVAVVIASPSIGDAFRRTATQAARDEFVATHTLARSAAIRHGRVAELHIDASAGRFWVEVDTSSTGSVHDTIGIVKNVATSKVDISSDRSLLCFDARGLPTQRGSCDAPDATVVFSAPERADTVTVTFLGRVLR